MSRCPCRVRTMLVGVAIFGLVLGGFRAMYARLTFCVQWAENYEEIAESRARWAFWNAHSQGHFGIGASWDKIRAARAEAAEHKARAAEFRAAAWRVWRPLPAWLPNVLPTIDSSTLSTQLPCPDDLSGGD